MWESARHTHYVTGYVLREQAEHPADSAAQALAPLPAGATLTAAIAESGGVLGEDAFEHGLSVVIAGTAALMDAEL